MLGWRAKTGLAFTLRSGPVRRVGVKVLLVLLGGIVLFAAVGPAVAGSGDPRLVNGILEWPRTVSNEPFIVVRGDDGVMYYVAIGAARHDPSLAAGGRVAVLGLEGRSAHEINALGIGAGESVEAALANLQGARPAPAAAAPPPAAASTPPAPTAASAPAPNGRSAVAPTTSPAPAATPAAPTPPAPLLTAPAPASPAVTPPAPTSPAPAVTPPPAGVGAPLIISTPTPSPVRSAAVSPPPAPPPPGQVTNAG